MKTENIKAIFTNLLFVIGIILLIFGFVGGVSTATKTLIFDKYPLDSYNETRCDMDMNNQPVYGPDGKAMPPTETKEEAADRKKKCLASLEQERKVKQTEDIVMAISTLVAGSVLVMSFKRFIFH